MILYPPSQIFSVFPRINWGCWCCCPHGGTGGTRFAAKSRFDAPTPSHFLQSSDIARMASKPRIFFFSVGQGSFAGMMNRSNRTNSQLMGAVAPSALCRISFCGRNWKFTVSPSPHQSQISASSTDGTLRRLRNFSAENRKKTTWARACRLRGPWRFNSTFFPTWDWQLERSELGRAIRRVFCWNCLFRGFAGGLIVGVWDEG